MRICMWHAKDQQSLFETGGVNVFHCCFSSWSLLMQAQSRHYRLIAMLLLTMHILLIDKSIISSAQENNLIHCWVLLRHLIWVSFLNGHKHVRYNQIQIEIWLEDSHVYYRSFSQQWDFAEVDVICSRWPQSPYSLTVFHTVSDHSQQYNQTP